MYEKVAVVLVDYGTLCRGIDLCLCEALAFIDMLRDGLRCPSWQEQRHRRQHAIAGMDSLRHAVRPEKARDVVILILEFGIGNC